MFQYFYRGRGETNLSCDAHSLLDRIEDLIENIEEEEEEEIDAPLFETIKSFMDTCSSFYERGDYEGAEITYRCLFSYLLTPLSDFSPPLLFFIEDKEKEIDLQKAQKEFFHSLYVSSSKENRGKRFIEAFGLFTLHNYLSPTFSFKNLREVQGDPLPDFQAFLEEMIEELKDEFYPELIPHLLIEAAQLLQGRDGIIALAKEMGSEFPEAYIEWIEILKREEDHRAIIEVAEKGVEIFVHNDTFRIYLQEELIKAAQSIGDTQLERQALLHRFSSSPSIDHMATLLQRESLDGCKPSEKLKRLLKDFAKDSTKNFKHQETSRALYLYLFLWEGEYKEIQTVFDEEKPFIFFRQQEKKVALTLFFRLFKKEGVATPNLDAIIENIEESFNISFLDKAKEKEFWDYTKKVFERADREVRRSCFLWCKNEVEEYVRAILDYQKRGLYGEAANQLAAFLESARETEWEEEAHDFCEKIRYSYLRLRNFQKEIEEVGLF